MNRITRRTFMGSLGAAATMPAFSESTRPPAGRSSLRPFPRPARRSPMIGLGTWITFNVGNDEKLRAARAQVMQTFFDRGGTLIDSSPMYGSSEGVVGYGLARTKRPALFCATKVWTMFKPLGVSQMENSRKLWGVERFDLLQVHNLLDWSTHLADAEGDEGAGPRALHRRHHLARLAPWRPRQHHAHRADRLRAVHLQRGRPRGGGRAAAAGGRARHRGDHQPAVPGRRAHQQHDELPAACRGPPRSTARTGRSSC